MKIIFYITPHENTRTGASVLKLHELEYDGSKIHIQSEDIKNLNNMLIVTKKIDWIEAKLIEFVRAIH